MTVICDYKIKKLTIFISQNHKHRFVEMVSLNPVKNATVGGKKIAKMRAVSPKEDILLPKNRRAD